MKLCLIGAAGHFEYVLAGLDDGVQLAAYAPGLAGERMGKLEAAFARDALSPQPYDDWRVMLDRERPDVVVVNTWFGHCAEITLACLQRGHHVYAEKPLATDLETLGQLQAAHRDAGVQLGAMFGLRYTPAMLSAWQFVRDGGIGAVRMVSAQKSYRLGQREQFFMRRASYGGTIPWVGAHAIDWLRWFAGAEFENVAARHSNVANRGHGDCEVTAACLFGMSDGVIGSLTLDYLRPDSLSRHGDDRVRVVGSGGIVEVRSDRCFALLEGRAEPSDIPAVTPPQCFADFIRAVRGQGTCLVSARDAFAVTQACLLARQAADDGGMASFGAGGSPE